MLELMFISDSLAEKVDQDLLARVKGAIMELGGEIKKEETKEKQKFSYPIKKRLLGFYSIFEFNLPPEKTEELQKLLNLETNILRFLIVDIDKLKTEQRKIKILKPIRHVETKPETFSSKVKIEELDKKLEEILKE